MLIPKKIRRTILEYLFKEGVMVAKKDLSVPKHHLVDVPNLYVVKLLQSLKSKGLVNETFNWQYYFWYLNNEGIEFLRAYLHLPEEIVPQTLKKPKVSATRPERPQRVEGRQRRDAGETAEGAEKKAAPSADFKPEFRGGVGRGARRDNNYRRDQPRQPSKQ